MELTEAELTSRSGSTAERVHRLVELGIVQPREDGHFRQIDIQRVRIADALEVSGLAVEDLGRLVREGHVTFPNLELTFRDPVGASSTTLAELAAEAGRDTDFVRRLYSLLGLPEPADGDSLREDDLEVMRAFLVDLDLRWAGIDDELPLRLAGLYGDSMRRIAEGVDALILKYLLSAREMLSPEDARRLVELSGLHLMVSAQMASWLFQRHAEAAILGNVVANIEDTLEATGIGRGRDQRPPAIAFLDLSGFTRLTSAQGDEEAAELALTLSRVVRASTGSRRGKMVKALGDGVMLYFAGPDDAVAAALELVETVPAAGLPPARVGISAGAVVSRDGDYFGRTVNVAARIADYARPREVLVSDAVTAVSAGDGVVFDEIGPIELKGVSEPVTLFRAARAR